MSKYYKAEDVINKYAEMIASDAYWEYGVGNGKVDEDSIDIAKMYFADLPIIEVSSNTAIRIVENECFRDDLSKEIKDYLFSDLRHKLYHEQAEVSEDCISRADLLSELRKGIECVDIAEYVNDTVWRTIENAPSVVPQKVIAQITFDEEKLREIVKEAVERFKEEYEPTTEQSSKVGEWQITDAYPHNVYCSECHKKFAQTHWAVWEDGSLPRNYCPNCGAKMK